MSKNEIIDALHQKDEIIQKQSRRIKMLEEKFTELRMKFFKLKYQDLYDQTHGQRLA